MRAPALLLVFLLVPALAVPAQAERRDQQLPAGDRLEFYEATVDPAQADRLSMEGFDVTARRDTPAGVEVDLVLSRWDVRRAESIGVDPEPKRNEGGLTSQQFAAAQADDGYTVWRSYSEPGGIADELRQTAAEHPDITKLVTIGESVAGQDILALKVTADARRVADGRRPAVLYSALQHAREWIAGEVNTRLLAHVTDGYGQDPEVTGLVDSRELWFVPVANPDGYDFTFNEGNRLWRKNLADNDGDGQITGVDGVDPNRNFATNWNYDDEGSSSDPSSATYRGSGPGSEPETQAMDGLLDRIDFAFQVNYHSYGPLLLYPFGFQVQTETADDPIYEALSGDPDKPAVEGTFPTLSSGLYSTNGETTDHSHTTYGTLAWTPELNEGCQGCGFVFPDDEALVQREFEINLDFALDIAASAVDPADPVSHLGNTTPDFEVDDFAVSHGSDQPVAVNAKRELGLVLMRYQIDGGRVRTVPTREWAGGERYGGDASVHYAERRGQVRNAAAGSEVEVWFWAPRAGVESERFTYTVAAATENPVLVLAAEDYTGLLPAKPGVTAPEYAGAYVDALAANGLTADVYDIDANGREAPHPLGVLSHYESVVWETGDDLIPRSPGQGPGTTAGWALNTELAVRDYLNEGGTLLFAGQYAGFAQAADNLYYADRDGPDTECTSTAYPCSPLSNDFLQYWLGAYSSVADGGTDPADGAPHPLVGTGNPFIDAAYELNGGDSADNQESTWSFLTTSSFLPPEEYPLFASDGPLDWDRAGGAPYEPFTGDWYVYSQRADATYKRLSRTVDLSDAASGALAFRASYDLEPNWDYLVVEARPVASDDWTTLPVPGITTQDTGDSCPADWRTLHPFLDAYQTRAADGTCTPTGTTGEWHGATGSSGGWQDWEVDLSGYAGGEVEVSITMISDFAVQGLGVFLDDARVLADGAVVAETSFESDLGGWAVAGPPEGTQANANDWERSQTAFEEGAAVTTEDTVYLGFGLEGVSTAEGRADLMGRVMDHLLGDGPSTPGRGRGGR